MKIGDKIGEHYRISSVCGCEVGPNSLSHRVVKDIKENKFQLQGDYIMWFYIKDIEQEPNYEIY